MNKFPDPAQNENRGFRDMVESSVVVDWYLDERFLRCPCPKSFVSFRYKVPVFCSNSLKLLFSKRNSQDNNDTLIPPHRHTPIRRRRLRSRQGRKGGWVEGWGAGGGMREDDLCHYCNLSHYWGHNWQQFPLISMICEHLGHITFVHESEWVAWVGGEAWLGRKECTDQMKWTFPH